MTLVAYSYIMHNKPFLVRKKWLKLVTGSGLGQPRRRPSWLLSLRFECGSRNLTVWVQGSASEWWDRNSSRHRLLPTENTPVNSTRWIARDGWTVTGMCSGLWHRVSRYTAQVFCQENLGVLDGIPAFLSRRQLRCSCVSQVACKISTYVLPMHRQFLPFIRGSVKEHVVWSKCGALIRLVILGTSLALGSNTQATSYCFHHQKITFLSDRGVWQRDGSDTSGKSLGTPWLFGCSGVIWSVLGLTFWNWIWGSRPICLYLMDISIN